MKLFANQYANKDFHKIITIYTISYKMFCWLFDSVASTLNFDGGQYMKVAFPEESVTEVEDISLRFQTERESGLLLVTSSQKSSDMLLLYLDRGKLKLEISISNQKEVGIKKSMGS